MLHDFLRLASNTSDVMGKTLNQEISMVKSQLNLARTGASALGAEFTPRIGPMTRSG
jgi:hypothetical protein